MSCPLRNRHLKAWLIRRGMQKGFRFFHEGESFGLGFRVLGFRVYRVLFTTDRDFIQLMSGDEDAKKVLKFFREKFVFGGVLSRYP